MSTDPNSGIAYITMYDKSGSTLSNGVGFSGVLIAPDEILTAAHGVTDGAGNMRNFGTAYLGYSQGTLTGGVSIDSVHVLDNTHNGSAESDSSITTDFAVVHLSQPVMTAATFALTTGTPGNYTVTGYPGSAGTTRVTVGENLMQGLYDGELVGTSLVSGQSSAGASGGPAYTSNNGVLSVGALVTASGPNGTEMFTGLTAADIAQIDAWVYSDDSADPWGSQFAPGRGMNGGGSGTGTTGGGSGGTGTASAPPVDRLVSVASALADAAGDTTPLRGLIMGNAALAITTAVDQGATSGDMPDAGFLAGEIAESGSAPNRSMAYVAGLLASEAGVSGGGLFGYIANVFGLDLGGSKQLRRLAVAGYSEDKSLGISTDGAAIADGMEHAGVAELGNVLRTDHVPAFGESSISAPNHIAPGATIVMPTNHHGFG